MTISLTEAENGTIRVAIDGPTTIYEAVDVKRDLLAGLERADRLEIDLAGVNELDTAGLQLLWLIRRDARSAGKQVWLTATSEAVTEVLNRYSLASFFEWSPPPDPAVETVPGANAAAAPEEGRAG